MPAQTTQKDMYFPDGCAVLVKAPGDSVYTDMGVLEGDATASFEYDEIQVETANAGKTAKKVKNMRVSGGFTLLSLNQEAIKKLGAGMFTTSTTVASATTSIPDQVIAANWADNVSYEIIAYTSSSDSTKLRLSAKPTLTSVTLDAGGTPETLTENNDYVVVADAGSSSGYAIQFVSANMTTLTPKTKAITIDFGSNVPVASTTMKAGETTKVLAAVEMMYKHTDSAGKVRSFYMPAVEPNSGGFAFNFKSASADGLESMPITFSARLDTTKTSGAQLFEWVIESGAE
jgi:hypothetical protein